MAARLCFFGGWLLLFVALLQAAEPKNGIKESPDGSKSHDGNPSAPIVDKGRGGTVSPDVQAAARANNEFAFALFAKLPNKEENLLFSPLSVTLAMGMTYGGARGETAAEIASAMRFKLPDEKLHPALADLQKSLAATNPTEEKKDVPTLQIANRLWGQNTYHFQEPFLKLTREQYGAELGQVDFIGQRLGALLTINHWIADHTGDKIKEAVPPGAIDETTRLVLANAVYFKARWTSAFDNTRESEFLGFKAGTEKAESVTLMVDQSEYRYVKIDGVQILEKPFRGDDLAMVILLPETGTAAFGKLRSDLAAGKLDGWLEKLKARDVKIYLPKFHVHTNVPLADTLQLLGIHRAFDATLKSTDFSGIDGSKGLFLANVFHQTDIRVDEYGTEATASTAEGGAFGGDDPHPAVVLRADHPFVFMIRDNRTGCILFLGQFTEPPAEHENADGGAF